MSEIDELVASARNSLSKDLCNSCCKSCLAMIDMTDCTNVYMRILYFSSLMVSPNFADCTVVFAQNAKVDYISIQHSLQVVSKFSFI